MSCRLSLSRKVKYPVFNVVWSDTCINLMLNISMLVVGRDVCAGLRNPACPCITPVTSPLTRAVTLTWGTAYSDCTARLAQAVRGRLTILPARPFWQLPRVHPRHVSHSARRRRRRLPRHPRVIPAARTSQPLSDDTTTERPDTSPGSPHPPPNRRTRSDTSSRPRFMHRPTSPRPSASGT